LIYFCIKTPNQTHFSKFSLKNIGSHSKGKNENKASTEIDFIQKLKKILPNREVVLKDWLHSKTKKKILPNREMLLKDES
jgi:hypothetical protein